MEELPVPVFNSTNDSNKWFREIVSQMVYCPQDFCDLKWLTTPLNRFPIRTSSVTLHTGENQIRPVFIPQGGEGGHVGSKVLMEDVYQETSRGMCTPFVYPTSSNSDF